MEKEQAQKLVEDIHQKLHFLDHALTQCMKELTRAQEMIEDARRILNRE